MYWDLLVLYIVAVVFLRVLCTGPLAGKIYCPVRYHCPRMVMKHVKENEGHDESFPRHCLYCSLKCNFIDLIHIILIFVLGYQYTNIVGKFIVRATHHWLLSIPFIRILSPCLVSLFITKLYFSLFVLQYWSTFTTDCIN